MAWKSPATPPRRAEDGFPAGALGVAGVFPEYSQAGKICKPEKSASRLGRRLFSWLRRSLALGAWAGVMELARISGTGLTYRLRQSATWLGCLVGQALERESPRSAQGRPVRIPEGASAARRRIESQESNKGWRAHGAFDLSTERFSHFAPTDDKGDESLDRTPAD